MKDRTHFLSSAEWNYRMATLGAPRRLPYLMILCLLAWVLIDTFRYNGSITGRIRDPSRKPISGVEVHLWDRKGKFLDATRTDSSGHYTIEGLRSGMYYAATVREDRIEMLYDNRSCPEGDCDPTTGYPILVEGDAVTGQIHFTLRR